MKKSELVIGQEWREIPDTENIGKCAGALWNYLNLHGRTSLIKLKIDIQMNAALTHLSLGWLLREDKVKFSNEKGQTFVELK